MVNCASKRRNALELLTEIKGCLTSERKIEQDSKRHRLYKLCMLLVVQSVEHPPKRTWNNTIYGQSPEAVKATSPLTGSSSCMPLM